MKSLGKQAEIYAPDGKPQEEALRRTTHAAIGAHQDDIEIMASHGILECFQAADKWFLGVTTADGSGSPRTGVYAGVSNEAMARIRIDEQNKAARIGNYAAAVQLMHSSAQIKDPSDEAIIAEYVEILSMARPSVVYTHNPADKHDTHVGVALKAIAAMRALPAESRPRKVYGCEVWRNLDWLQDDDKQVLDVSGRENLTAALLGVYDSQIAGGKRYDLATSGRWRTNATYFATHATDTSTGMGYAMDLTPLIADPGLDVGDYTQRFIERFSSDVRGRIAKLRPRGR